MRAIVVGLDPAVLEAGSPSAQRQLGYFSGIDADIFEMVPGPERHVALSATVRSHAVGGANRFSVAWSTLRAVRTLVRTASIDVVTTQDPHVCGLIGFLACFGTRTRFHIQDHSGLFARATFGAKDFFLHLVARVIAREAHRIRTVSQRGRRGLAEVGIPPERIDVAPIATDIDAFTRVRHVPSDHPRLLSVARLFREKGVDVLLNAFGEVVKKHPNATLAVIGDGPEKAMLEHQSQKLGIASSVSFVGSKTGTEIRRSLEEADVYVQPSRFEGWGIAVVEAAAAGVPVVMTDVGCAGEIIIDGKSGRVVPTEDPSRLALAIMDAIAHPERSNAMADEAKRNVQQLPTVEESTRRIRASLESASAAPSLPSPVFRLFAVAFAIRFLLFLALRLFVGPKGFELGDSIQYLGLAKSLLAGQGFLLDGQPFFFRTVGYPLLLAGGLAAFRSTTGFVLCQTVIASFIPLLVLKLGKQLRLGTRATWIAAWLAALEPHLVFYSATIMAETFFTLSFLFGISWTFRAMETKRVGDSVRAGLAFGVGMLIKPLLQLFPVALLVCMGPWWKHVNWRQAIKHTLVVCVVVFAILAPWMIRNRLVFGKFALSSQGAVAALHYLGSSIVSIRDRIPYQEAERRVRDDFARRYSDALSPKEQESAERSLAIGYVREQPMILARILAINTVTFWTSVNWNSFLNYYHLTPPIDHSVLPPTHYLAQGRYGEFVSSFWKIFSQPFYFVGALGRLVWLVITILFAVGFVSAYRRIPDRRMPLVFLLALCAYLTAVIWVDGLGIEARLRFPLMPIEFLFAAFGWTILRPRPSRVKKLLVITQRVDANDTNLAVHVRWLTAFATLAESVTVIAQSVGAHDLPKNVRVLSLGKERGASKLGQLGRLIWFVLKEVPACDAILVLMVPLYVLLSEPIAWVFGKPIALWYVHKRVSFALRAAVLFVHRVFSASKESFRLDTSKVRYLGHAIDTEFFSPDPSVRRVPGKIVTVGRVAPVKRIERMIEAVKQLREEGRDARLDVIGTAILPQDVAYEKKLASSADAFVAFLGGRSPSEVRDAYRSASVCVNASETGSLDKAMLEAMACECPVVTSNEAFAKEIPPDGFVRDGNFVSAIRSQLDRPSTDTRSRVTARHDMKRTLSALFADLI